MTHSLSTVNVLIRVPLLEFHIFIVLSVEPLANKPPGIIARDLTDLVCPINVFVP